MISLIICSRQPDIPQSLKDNIAETIGVEYELVIIDNSENQYSIFQAYNEGVRRARYPYLCFMHDDILYHTQDWGEKVIEHFQDEKVGLIGVVGGHYLPDCPASWWSTECRSGKVIQGYFDNLGKYCVKEFNWNRYNVFDNKSIIVSVVDGFWFCIRKGLFDKVRFDENFKGFHCYDLDISMQIQELGYDVRVIFDNLIEHFSFGNLDIDLFKQNKLFYQKWKNDLPVIKGIDLTNNEILDRKYFVEKQNEIQEYIFYQSDEIRKIQFSKEYRLGKFILKPFSLLKRILKQ